MDLESGAGLLHRLTSYVLDRSWDVPVDDHQVRHDLVPNDPATRPPPMKVYRGPDVVPQMHWFPFLTFWQVTCDMIVGLEPPPGHGHHYGPEVPTAWVDILHSPR